MILVLASNHTSLSQLINMVGLFLIFKIRRLLNIHKLIDVPIEKCTFHIYLVQPNVVGTSIDQQDPNCFQSYDRGICFSKVNSLTKSVCC
jgi:hypothetical protein